MVALALLLCVQTLVQAVQRAEAMVALWPRVCSVSERAACSQTAQATAETTALASERTAQTADSAAQHCCRCVLRVCAVGLLMRPVCFSVVRAVLWAVFVSVQQVMMTMMMRVMIVCQ